MSRDARPAFARLDPGVTYVHSALPEEGERVEVAEGVHWLRLPLPYALDHVNLWLLDDDGGWTVVDTGIATARTRAVWQRMLAGLLGGRPLRRLVVTHYHPDHMGLAGWLCAMTGAPLWASRTEWLLGRMLALDATDGYVAASEAFYRRAGLSEEAVRIQRERGNPYRRAVVPPPATYRRVRAGEVLEIGGRAWRVIVGEGHAPEQVTLYSEELRLLIAADQVLPRITPNVGVSVSQPDGNPLADFMASLARYENLPDDVLVLPSHDQPYAGLQARIAGLRRHHAARLDQVIEACRQPRRAAEVMGALFPRPLDAHQTMFAVGETLAHLNLLVGEGRLERWLEADGRDRYRRAP